MLNIKKCLFVFIIILTTSCGNNKSIVSKEILKLESSVSPSIASMAGSHSAALLFFIFDLNGKLNFNLNNNEIKLHEDAIYISLNYLNNGELISWHNKDRFSMGKVRIVATYMRDKKYCRILQSYIKLNGAEKHDTKNICLLNSNWKVL